MDWKGAGKWGVAGIVGVAGAAGAFGAFFFDKKSGEKRRRAVTKQTKAVEAAAKRETAHIAAMIAKRTNKSETPKDALEQNVREALDAAGGHDIEVHVRGGVVRLRGEVSEMSEIRTYGRVVASVEGVNQVDNVLRYSG